MAGKGNVVERKVGIVLFGGTIAFGILSQSSGLR